MRFALIATQIPAQHGIGPNRPGQVRLLGVGVGAGDGEGDGLGDGLGLAAGDGDGAGAGVGAGGLQTRSLL